HSQTRTGTVIGRPPRKLILARSQLRFPLPARIAPPRWGTRGLRCECSLPSARREPFRELVWPADITWPWKYPRLAEPARRTSLLHPSAHTPQAVFLRTFQR